MARYYLLNEMATLELVAGCEASLTKSQPCRGAFKACFTASRRAQRNFRGCCHTRYVKHGCGSVMLPDDSRSTLPAYAGSAWHGNIAVKPLQLKPSHGNPLKNNNLHRRSMNLSVIDTACLNKFPMLRIEQRVALPVHGHSNPTLPTSGLSA